MSIKNKIKNLFFKKDSDNTPSLKPAPKAPERGPRQEEAIFLEDSRAIEEVLFDWRILPSGCDNDGLQEVYDLSREVVAAAGQSWTPQKSLLHKFWAFLFDRKGTETGGASTPSAIAKRFAKDVADLLKVHNMLQGMLDIDIQQHDVLIVLPADTFLSRDSQTGHWLLHPMEPFMERISGEVLDALTEMAEKMWPPGPGRKPDNFRELFSARIYVQTFVIATTGHLAPDKFAIVTKQRTGSDAINFRLIAQHNSNVLFAETKGVIDRLSNPGSQRGPIRRAVYPEKYEFFLCRYPYSKVRLCITDIAVPESPPTGMKVPTCSKRLRVRKSPIPRRNINSREIVMKMREFAGTALDAEAYEANMSKVYENWMSTTDAGIKGNIAWLGVGCPNPGGGWNVSLPPKPEARIFDRLRIDRLNYFPEWDRSAMQDEFAMDLNQLAEIIAAIKDSDDGAKVWASTTTLGVDGRTAAKGVFRIDFKNQHYRLRTYPGLSPNLSCKFAPRMELNPTATEDPNFLQKHLLRFLESDNPDWNRQIDDTEGLRVGDGVFYFGIGTLDTGYLLFIISTASRAFDNVKTQEIPMELQQAHLLSFCERKGLTNLRRAFADRIFSQGELFFAHPPENPGKRLFVKVFWGQQLQSQKKALRKVWPILQKHGLLPPGHISLAVNSEYKEVVLHDANSVVWIIATPEFQTLEKRLGEPLDFDERLKICNQLRAFYQKALSADLVFPDCAAEDLVLLPNGTEITLIDFGSYLPMAQWADDPLPRKDDYSDPALVAWQKWTPERLSQSEDLALRQHAYNLGLLQARVLTDEICAVAATPDANDIKAAEENYERRLAVVMAKIAEKCQHLPSKSIVELQRDTTMLLNFDVNRRPSPLDLTDLLS